MDRTEADIYFNMALRASVEVSAEVRAISLDALDNDEKRVLESLKLLSKDDPRLALVMAANLWHFWWERGHASQGLDLLSQLLAGYTGNRDIRWGKARFVFGHLTKHLAQSDERGDQDRERARLALEDSKEVFKNSNEIIDEVQRRDLESLARRHLAIIAWQQARYGDALELLEASPGNPELPRESRSSRSEVGETLYELGNLHRAWGVSLVENDAVEAELRLKMALRDLTKGWGYCEESYNRRSQGTALLAMGNTRLKLAEIASKKEDAHDAKLEIMRARANYLDALARFPGGRDKSRIVLLLERVAWYAWHKALQGQREMGAENAVIGECVIGARLLGISDQLRKETNSPRPTPDQGEFYDTCRRGLEKILEGRRFIREHKMGTELTLAEAIDQARALLLDEGGLTRLSRKEVENSIKKAYPRHKVRFYATESSQGGPARGHNRQRLLP